MTNYNFGDVVLVTFPFSDLKSLKKRPCVIISSSSFNNWNDVIIMAISGNILIESSQNPLIKNWKQAGLLKESIFKPVVATDESNLIIKHIGELSNQDKMILVNLLERIFEINKHYEY